MTRYYSRNEDGSVTFLGTDIYGAPETDFGLMQRRVERLEREQSLLGKRIDELEARLRAENTHPIPGDIGHMVEAGLHYLRMLPPEQGDEHR